MDDPPLQKIAISGPTLASLIQRFSTSPSAIHGLLYGHVTDLPATLSDDAAVEASPTLLATVTAFLSSPDPHLSAAAVPTHSAPFLGWFSARRRSPLRPSMREFSLTTSLSSQSQSPNPKPSPFIFLLLASPPSDPSHIHTHEYRAFQFCGGRFEPRSLDVVNIGPAFRGHYGAFSPSSPLPPLRYGPPRGSPMSDDGEERLGRLKQAAKDQRKLDACADGFDVGRLSRMMGSEAKSYTEGLEELYQKMLLKIENLTCLVEKTSAMVLEQLMWSAVTPDVVMSAKIAEKTHCQFDPSGKLTFGNFVDKRLESLAEALVE
ncbi:hypothetical protein VNO78_25598 [Psophocarpus tetragonolobus]|uniref:Uncharacterized protein n=1 Tax=Psophocarpus tetragonolobus TaxID=3891 RepID=A0AAN9S829_PSOTE